MTVIKHVCWVTFHHVSRISEPIPEHFSRFYYVFTKCLYSFVLSLLSKRLSSDMLSYLSYLSYHILLCLIISYLHIQTNLLRLGQLQATSLGQLAGQDAPFCTVFSSHVFFRRSEFSESVQCRSNPFQQSCRETGWSHAHSIGFQDARICEKLFALKQADLTNQILPSLS